MSRGRRDIILATRNPDKLAEIRAALVNLPARLLSLEAFPNVPEVVEDQNTLEGNAIKKARVIHEATGLPALADDTGLFVEALHGAPGVYSSRYAGPNATYTDNVQKLLRAMKGFELAQRKAVFRSVMAFAHENEIECVHGECVGTIAMTSRGAGKFGYDPVFLVDERGKTYAEMSMAEKNQISHRGRALRAAGKLVAAWLANGARLEWI